MGGYGRGPAARHASLFDAPDAGPGSDGTEVVRDVGEPLAPGDRVRHPYFGEGWLADSQGSGTNVRVTIDFDVHGRKQLLLSHARLERIP